MSAQSSRPTISKHYLDILTALLKAQGMPAEGLLAKLKVPEEYTQSAQIPLTL